MTKSCKDAMKLMSPQCVLHKFLLLQDVAARCPFNLTPGPRLHNADVVLENVTLTFEKHTDNVFEEWITLWIVSVGITSRM